MDYTKAKLYRPSKGNDWYVYYSFRCPATGAMKLFKERGGINRVKGIKERKEAFDDLINATNNRLKSGWSPFVEPDRNEYHGLTLLQAFDEIYKVKEASLRLRSSQHYKSAIKIFREFLEEKQFTSIAPDKFTPPMASSYSDFLVVKKRYSGRTHNNHIRNMRTLFYALIEKETVLKNPFKNIKKLQEEIGKNIAFPDHIRDKIKEHIAGKNLPIEWGMMLQYYCFVRPYELTLLQGKHLDFKNKKIYIRSSNSKSKMQDSVVIPDIFFDKLKEKYENIPDHYYLFSTGLIPGEQKIWRNRLSEAHKSIMDELKCDSEYTFYSWKHTGAIAAYRAGVSLYDLMRQLRHTSLEYTQIYFKSMGVFPNEEFATKQPKF